MVLLQSVPGLGAPRRFDPVGVCIYCGSTEPPLTDEHTIADGLNGNVVLPEASCEVCREMTQKFEQVVMRGMTWPLRHGMKMHARKRKPPETIPTYLARPKSEPERLMLKPDDIPVKAVFPSFPHLPGLLCGRDRDAPSEAEIMGIIDMDAMGRAEAEGFTDISVYANEWAFVRTLAKIAHAQAVGIYGLDGFDACLPAIIRGIDKNWAYFVGRSIDGAPREGERDHWMHIMQRTRDGLLMAHIQLFARVDAPVYTVIIGRLKEVRFGLGMRAQLQLRGGNMSGAPPRLIDSIRHRLESGRYGSIPHTIVDLDEAA